MASIDDRTCPKLRRFESSIVQRWLQLPTEHRGLVDQHSEPQDLLWSLRQHMLWREAIRMLAYTLPEREAIWWSCKCVRHTAPAPTDLERSALEAAEAWVRWPEPAFRTEAAIAASACGIAAPGAWSALGVTWSHRKKFLPDLCGGRGAVTAVMRTAVRNGADRLEQRLRRFITSGINVGNGGAGHLPIEDALS